LGAQSSYGEEEQMMASLMWMNVPMMVLAFALTVGIPMRMLLRDRGESSAPRIARPVVASAVSAHRERAGELVAA
jgi:hypothetical protein